MLYKVAGIKIMSENCGELQFSRLELVRFNAAPAVHSLFADNTHEAGPTKFSIVALSEENWILEPRENC